MTKQASAQGLEWFQDAKFGMFVHWGLTAVPARSDAVMYDERIPVAEYEKFAEQFNPVKFNADEWVSIAADAGQKYIVFTSRHHDGFSMYDTKLSDYKVTNTPFRRDPVRELADACARRGDIKLGFYSSLLDWHHPAYSFRQESGLAWSDYLEFLHGQVRELCTNYGEIACMWFDGHWPRAVPNEFSFYTPPGGSYEYDQLYDLIHTLQPDAVILNNHHIAPQPGEDVQGFEQELPGFNAMGFNTTEVSPLPREVCMTINDRWFYVKADRNHKSPRTLIHYLARSASVGANNLLDVGPTAEGEILPTQAAHLLRMGEWLKHYGEAIYGTREGRIPPTEAAVATRKGEGHYVHALDYISDCITLQNVPDSLRYASLLRDGQPVEMERRGDTITLILPEAMRDPIDTIVVLSP